MNEFDLLSIVAMSDPENPGPEDIKAYENLLALGYSENFIAQESSRQREEMSV